MKNSEKKIYHQYSQYSLEVIEGARIENIEIIWSEIEQSSQTHIFTSWLWIGSWLKNVLQNEPYYFVRISLNQQNIACCILVPYLCKRHLIVTSHQIYLNELPVNNRNMVIEYNSVLVKNGFEEEVHKVLNQFMLEDFSWDELVISAATSRSIIPKPAADILVEKLDKTSTAYSVVMNDGRYGNISQLKQSILSRNKRHQINRSMNRYEQRLGKLELSIAQNRKEALKFFHELGKLHTSYWNNKGNSGSFANPIWVAFHEQIICDGFDSGNIQLSKVSYGDKTIGYIYNLVLDDHIYNIQSGFDYSEDNRDKPGLVCHWLMIERNFNDGMRVYDFLVGGEAYKKSLGNTETTMTWYILQKKKNTFRVEDSLRNIKSYVQNFLHLS